MPDTPDRADFLPHGAEGKVPPEATLELFDVPTFYASGLQVFPIANDVILSFNAARAGMVTSDGKAQTAVQISAAVSVTVSILTLKEMATAIQTQVENYEKENGVIQTPFLRAKKG